MSTLLCQCGSVVPVDESIGMQCRACHDLPLQKALDALRPFATKAYETVQYEDGVTARATTASRALRATFEAVDVMRARDAVRAIENRTHPLVAAGVGGEVWIGAGGGGGAHARSTPGFLDLLQSEMQKRMQAEHERGTSALQRLASWGMNLAFDAKEP